MPISPYIDSKLILTLPPSTLFWGPQLVKNVCFYSVYVVERGYNQIDLSILNPLFDLHSKRVASYTLYTVKYVRKQKHVPITNFGFLAGNYLGLDSKI